MHARLLCLPSQSYLPLFAFSFISASSYSSLFLDCGCCCCFFRCLHRLSSFALVYAVLFAWLSSINLLCVHSFRCCCCCLLLLSLVLRLYSPLLSFYFFRRSLFVRLFKFWPEIAVNSTLFPFNHIPLICALVLLSLAEILWCETTMLLVSLTTKFTLNPCSQ